MEYYLSKSNSYPHFAVRFACKEAIIKVINAFGEKIYPQESQILNRSNGVPYTYQYKAEFLNFLSIIALRL